MLALTQILHCLKKHGQRLDSELAEETGVPIAKVRQRIAELAATGRLVSYSADLTDIWRRAAVFVDKILKGAKPADLPVEQPTKFEFVINLGAAKSIGLTIPRVAVVARGRRDAVGFAAGHNRSRIDVRSTQYEVPSASCLMLELRTKYFVR